MKRIAAIFSLIMLVSLVFVLGAHTLFADTVDKKPTVRLTKTGILDISAIPWVINYTYTIENKTSGDLVEVTLEDDKLGTIVDLSDNLKIEKNTKVKYTASYEVKSGDYNKIENIATVKATNQKNNENMSQQATCTVYLPPVRLEKAGIWRITDDTIDYQFTITNTGANILEHIALEDKKIEFIAWEAGFNGTLKPGESCLATGTFVVADGAFEVENTAMVTASFKDSKCEGEIVSAIATCIVIKPQNGVPLPDMGAGMLFGTGIAGLGAFILIRKQIRSSRQP